MTEKQRSYVFNIRTLVGKSDSECVLLNRVLNNPDDKRRVTCIREALKELQDISLSWYEL